MKWFKTPKGYVAMAMVIYLLIASIGSKEIMGIQNGLAALFVAILVDLLFQTVKMSKWTRPDGAIITALIITLILGTTTTAGVVALTAAIAILSKHLLVYKKKPIFNPAAFGLLASIPLFHTEQSWWGAFGDLPVWTMLFLIIGGYLVTNRVNKFPQVFSFLGISFALFLLMGQLNIGDAVDALRPPFINATLFFGFFMLTDPPTSPGKYKDQVLFGLITGGAGTIIYGMFGGLTYLFIGLFIGNLYAFLKKRSSAKVSMNRLNIKNTRTRSMIRE